MRQSVRKNARRERKMGSPKRFASFVSSASWRYRAPSSFELPTMSSDKPAETTNQARSTDPGFQNWQSGRRSDSGSFDDWPQRIATAWQQTVHGIIETGKLLIEAKVCLGHGRFSDMIRDQLPFLPRAAQKLMSIAENPALANSSHE